MKWVADHKWGIWAFAVATAFIPHIMSSALLPRWAAMAIGAPLVSRLSFDRLSQSMQYVLILGFSWAACSVWFSPDKLTGIWLCFFILLMIGCFIAASELESLDDAMAGLALGIGVSSVLCWLFVAGIRPVEQYTVRPAGLFYNSELLAEFTAPVLLWCLLRQRWSLVLLTVTPLLFCQSRVSFLALIGGLAYAGRSRRWWLNGAILTVAVAGLTLGTLYQIGSITPGGDASAATRIVVWGATLLAATPLGNGLGWFQAAHPLESWSHSDALQAVNELGVGAVFLLAIPVLIFRSNGGSNADRAAFVAVCITVLVSFPLHVPAGAFLASVIAGFLAGDGFALSRVRSRGRVGNEEGHQTLSADGGTDFGRSRPGRAVVPVRSGYAWNAAMGAV